MVNSRILCYYILLDVTSSALSFLSSLHSCSVFCAQRYFSDNWTKLSVQSYTCTYTNYASQIKWMNWDNFPNNPSQKKKLFSTSIDAKIILALTSFFWGRHCMHVGVSGGLRREMREGEKEPFHCRILRH